MKSEKEIKEKIDENGQYNTGTLKELLELFTQEKKKWVEEIEKEIPLYNAGALEEGETREGREIRNNTLKEIREILSRIKKD